MKMAKNTEKTVELGDVWASEHRRVTVTRISGVPGGMSRVQFEGKTGARSEAWSSVFVRNRVLVERDGKPVGGKPAEPQKTAEVSAPKALGVKTRGPKPLPDVRVGDVWANNDPRATCVRLLRVKEVLALTVIVIPVGGGLENARPRDLARRRFKPTSNGYKLVERDGKKVA
jgi:hypothetical protein